MPLHTICAISVFNQQFKMKKARCFSLENCFTIIKKVSIDPNTRNASYRIKQKEIQ
jgi:hypothetical protein